MRAYLASSGFEVLEIDHAVYHLHVGYLCKLGAPDPDALANPALVDDQWRAVHAIQSPLPWDGLALRLNSPNLVRAEGVWYHLVIPRFELGLDRANR